MPPQIDSAAGEAAIKLYDSDGDSMLSGAELDESPALKSALARLDANRDSRLDAEEINARIKLWRESRVGLTTASPTIRLDGRPLAGATVIFVPEPFLEDAVEPAQAVTNDRGIARMRISDDPDLAGIRVGFYRVQVSKIVNGKELIPARYNSQTEIGIEIASDIFETRNPSLNLASR